MNAERVQVKLGRSSVNTIEVLSGLKVGDQVILSDMSAYDAYDRIRLEIGRTSSRPATTRRRPELVAQAFRPARRRSMAENGQALIKLDGVTKVFFTDEVETHALSGIHLQINSMKYNLNEDQVTSLLNEISNPALRNLFRMMLTSQQQQQEERNDPTTRRITLSKSVEDVKHLLEINKAMKIALTDLKNENEKMVERYRTLTSALGACECLGENEQ